jgi:hypothetical protein
MKTAENRSGCDGADALNSLMDRAISVQSAMSLNAVVVAKLSTIHSANLGGGHLDR